MIRAMTGDLTKLEGVEYICNAANGRGPMGGGVAGAIRRAGGEEIEREAIERCQAADVQPGDLYVTGAGKLPYKQVIHLVTMKEPAGETSYSIVERCLQNLIQYCRGNQIHRVALPALGTGVGGLDPQKVAEIFRRMLEPVEDIEFWVVDINPDFIERLQRPAADGEDLSQERRQKQP